MGFDRAFDWLGLVLIVGAILIMVRPRSQGPRLVEVTTKGIVDIVKSVTGGGGWD